MIISRVKVNQHNRVKILCSYCNGAHPEVETYAVMDKRFHYICMDCVSYRMSMGENIVEMYDSIE
jgi:hypothetical protein